MERDSLVQYSATWLAAGGDASESFRTRLAESAIGLRQYLGKQGFSRRPVPHARQAAAKWRMVCARANPGVQPLQFANAQLVPQGSGERASRQGMEEGLVRLGL
jgi:hypothetical protein